MPRTPRNPGSGKRPVNTPARGDGMGEGWGGSAKGASSSRLAAAGDEYSDAIRALALDPRHAASKAPLRELAFRTWVQVARDGESESARVVAAEKLMDRLDGKATQRSEIGGLEGGPVRIERVIIDPAAD
jgi:hypothetical protein